MTGGMWIGPSLGLSSIVIGGGASGSPTIVIQTIDGQPVTPDMVVPSTTPTLAGYVTNPGGAVSGITIEFYRDGVLDGSTTTDGSGNFSYTYITPLSAGVRSITVIGYFPGAVSGGVNVTVPEAETFTYLNAVAAAGYTSQPTDWKAQINTMIAALKTGGAWTPADKIHVLAMPDSRACICLKTQTALTLVGSPTFTTDRGYTGDGTTMRLSTGFNPTTGTPNFAQNSMTLSVYSLTSGANGNYHYGYQSSGSVKVRARGTTNSAGSANNGGTAVTSLGTGVMPLDVSVIRTDSANQMLYQQGVLNNTLAAASSAVVSGVVNFLAVSGNFSSAQVAAGYVGGGLTGPQELARHNAFHDYLQARGAVT